MIPRPSGWCPRVRIRCAGLRTGPFRDFVEGRAEPPPIAALLGFELLAVDSDAGTIEVAFTAGDERRLRRGHETRPPKFPDRSAIQRLHV
jgi:hypothetical protein